MRIDENRIPTAFKCATVSTEELILLKKVKNIIRNGRIESLEKDKIVFKDKRFVWLGCLLIIFLQTNNNNKKMKNYFFS